MIECFVIYLAGHNRPVHEVLFSNDKEIAAEYQRAFIGMTTQECPLDTLLETRKRLKRELPARLNENQRRFLISMASAQPDWSLLQCRHAEHLPALRWKLANLNRFQKSRPEAFNSQIDALRTGLAKH